MTGRRQLTAFVADLHRFAGSRGAWALSAMVAGAVAEGVGLALLLPLLGVLLVPETGQAPALAERAFGWTGVGAREGRLALVLTAFVMAMIVRAGVLVWRDRVLMTLQVDFTTDLRARLLNSIERARWSDLALLRHARVVQAIGADGDRVAAGAQVVVQIAAAVAMLAAQWLLVLLISPALAMAALLLIGLAALLLWPTLRRAARLGRGLASGRLSMADRAGQLLGGLKAAMAQGTQALFLRDLASSGREHAAQRLELLRRTGLSRVVATTAIALAGAALIAVGTMTGASPVALLAALAVLTRMAAPLMTIQQNAQFLSDQVPAHAATLALIDELRASEQPPSLPHPLPSRAPIRFADLSYCHAQGAGVHDLGFTLQPGEIVGLAGASGAGKTTLVDLLAGLLTSQAGRILVGDVPLDEGTMPAWRARLAYVGQDAFLSHDTLRRNLLAGAVDADSEAIARAIAIAGADEVVAGLPDGLDTIVAERGGRLSGGQRQRFALARALLRRPELLILDEATNALDPAAEQTLLSRLAALDPRPTTVIVAHRPAALAGCDRIIVLDAGRVVSISAPGGGSLV